MILYNKHTRSLEDTDDGQIIATLSDGATHEQGEALARTYNADNVKYFCKHLQWDTYADAVTFARYVHETSGVIAGIERDQ